MNIGATLKELVCIAFAKIGILTISVSDFNSTDLFLTAPEF